MMANIAEGEAEEFVLSREEAFCLGPGGEVGLGPKGLVFPGGSRKFLPELEEGTVMLSNLFRLPLRLPSWESSQNCGEAKHH
ncbi:hypothetical protein COLO4_05904 [Corchorus olitorius]|uniref:Uncharacterized protein n=1 Tax=Corchorus olitorius TaxID=93759 RepID=A0A1R3KPJ1_9ROSI|nr:hypothetical protein COLO4_05904 [Corchorus olitorius]